MLFFAESADDIDRNHRHGHSVEIFLAAGTAQGEDVVSHIGRGGDGVIVLQMPALVGDAGDIEGLGQPLEGQGGGEDGLMPARRGTGNARPAQPRP